VGVHNVARAGELQKETTEMNFQREIIKHLMTLETEEQRQQAIAELSPEHRLMLVHQLLDDVSTMIQAVVENADQIWETKQFPKEIMPYSDPCPNCGKEKVLTDSGYGLHCPSCSNWK
jgi:NADH pyrophosphatase NudC (nudix superfamily)